MIKVLRHTVTTVTICRCNYTWAFIDGRTVPVRRHNPGCPQHRGPDQHTVPSIR